MYAFVFSSEFQFLYSLGPVQSKNVREDSIATDLVSHE